MGLAAFDRDDLVKRLGKLPGPSRVAFAYACASRLAQPYREAVALEGGVGEELVERTLADLAAFLNYGAPSDWAARAATLIGHIPDEDQMGRAACQVLDDALAATAYAARTAIAFDPAEAASSAQRLYDAVDAHAQRSLEFSIYSPAIEQRLLEHSAVQSELERQRRDLAALESSGTDIAATNILAQVGAERAFRLSDEQGTSG